MNEGKEGKNSGMKGVIRTAILIGFILLFLVAGCRVQGEEMAESATTQGGQEPSGSALTRYKASFLGAFDTLTTVIGYTEDQEVFDEYVRQIKEELLYYHRLFDIYNSYEGVNNLHTINERAGREAVKVDPAILTFLKQCVWANEVSAGSVNCAFGAVLTIWHDYRTAGTENPDAAELPPWELLEAASQHVDIGDLVLDEEAGTVFLRDPDMSLDVGSGAKGWAAEQVALSAEEAGLHSAVLSVGGNIRAIGRRADSDAPWRIGLQNPDKSSTMTTLDVLLIDNGSVVTSGIYERYYTVDGVRYHHIIDPVSLFPETRFDAVTIVTPSSALADALTTALFNLSLEEGKALIESLDQVDALWIKGEQRWFTEGYEDYVAE